MLRFLLSTTRGWSISFNELALKQNTREIDKMHNDFTPEILPIINSDKIIRRVFLFTNIDNMCPFTS